MVAALVAVAVSAQAATPVTLDREQALARAFESSPELRQQMADVEAARGVVNAEDRLLGGNPQLGLSAGTRRRPDAESILELSIALQQPLELGGAQGARERLARARLARAVGSLDALRARVAARVSGEFASALAAQRRLELAGTSLDLARDALNAAHERFQAGAATQLEVNAAEVEGARAMQALAAARRDDARSREELSALLALDPGTALDLRGTLPAKAAVLDPDVLQQRIEDLPQLREARAELDAARAGARLAGAEGLPGVAVGASYNREENANVTQGTLSMELPIFERNQAARAAAAGDVTRAEIALAARRRELGLALERAVVAVRAAAEAATAYQGAAGNALAQTIALANEAYRAGKIDFLQLLLLRHQAIQGQLSQLDAQEQLARAEADLAAIVGRTE